MAWTEFTRRQHARVGDKYASDLTDAEWALIEQEIHAELATLMAAFSNEKLEDGRHVWSVMVTYRNAK